jgi:hypothetical protein
MVFYLTTGMADGIYVFKVGNENKPKKGGFFFSEWLF